MSMPNRRRHVSALSTACGSSPFNKCKWIFRQEASANSTFGVARCSNSTISCSAFSKLPLRSSHSARSSHRLNVNSYWLLQSLSSKSAMPAEKYSRSEEHTSELQSPCNLVCRLLLEKKKKKKQNKIN